MVDGPPDDDRSELTRLRQAVQESGEVIFMTDREGLFTFVNARFERLYGYSSGEIVGRATPRVLKSGEAPPEQYAAFWQRLLRGETVESEFTNRKKDGGLLNVHGTVSPILDNGHAIVGFLAVQRDISERKQADAALYASDERYRALIEWSPEAVAVHRGGKLLYVNPTAVKMLGATSARDLVGKPVLDLVHPDFHQLVLERLRDYAGAVPMLEEKLVRLDGTVIDVEVQGTSILYDGEPASQVSIRDVTDRNRAHEALYESQRRLELIIRASNIGLWDWNLLDNTVYFSPQWKSQIGFTDDEIPNRFEEWQKRVHPDDLEEALARVREYLAKSEGEDENEFRFQHKDGSYRWILARSSVLKDAQGKPYRVLGSHVDITERKRSEETLRENERRLGLAVANSGMSVFAQDRDLRFTWIYNPQLGKTVAQMIGKTEADFFPPDLADQFILLKRRAMDTDERVHGEISADVGGQKCVFELLVEPVRNAAGEIEGIRGALLDITKRRELEDQLRQSQKLEAVGSLAGGIAHDFNNLLTAILGYADLAIDALDPANPIRADIEEIQRAGHSAEALTRQLLIFSRKGIVQPVLLPLNGIVTRLEKILRRVVGEDVEFRVRLGPSLGSVKADAGQLEQVVMNLVVNARDAMPSGGTLTLETDCVQVDEAFAASHGGSAVGQFDRLRVIDTGCGMTPEVQAQIFNPFFTTKGPEKGTGLGLATVHGIVYQAGGYVAVTSAPGQGSTFAIYLPRVAGQADSPRAGPTAIPAGVETILFVEDDESIRTLGVRILRQYGYTVVPARHAAEALTLAEAHGRIDLLATDLVMPGVNGRVLAERLRQSRGDLKVLYTSGYTSDSVTLHDIQTSGLDFLQKPYTVEALVRAVRTVLDHA
jgi:PAS domain S-box-containing protein